MIKPRTGRTGELAKLASSTQVRLARKREVKPNGNVVNLAQVSSH